MKHDKNAFGSLAPILLSAVLALPAISQEQDGVENDGQDGVQTNETPADTAATEPARFESRAERDHSLLADTFPRQARQLVTAEGDLTALFTPARHSEAKGTLLMLYTGDRITGWSPAWENLRRGLPYHGWATMALAMPPAALPEVPPRPIEETVAEKTENDQPPGDDIDEEAGQEADDAAGAPQAGEDEPGENEEDNGDGAEDDATNDANAGETPAETDTPPPMPRDQRIAARLEAVLALLAQEGQQNLVVLVDNASAPDVLEQLRPNLVAGGGAPGKSPLAGPVRALILVNRYPANPLSEAQLQTLFSAPEMPFLDLFPGKRSRPQQRQLHQGIAEQQNLKQYRSVALPYPRNPDLDNHRNAWVRRFQTFMDYQAWAGQ